MLENALHAALRKQVTTGWLSVTYPSGRIEQYGDGGGPPVAVRFADPNALRAVALDPGLAVAEMYMDGRLLLDVGDVYDLIALFKRATRPELATPGAWLQHLRRSITDAPVLRAIGLKSRAVERRPPLRPRRAALPPLPRRRHAVLLRLVPGAGHGPRRGAARQEAADRRQAPGPPRRPRARHRLRLGRPRALPRAGLRRPTSPASPSARSSCGSPPQRVEAAGLGDRIEFRLQDYREIEGEFDNIVSVGMFEHVGLRQYPAFFRTAARLLAPDGVMLLHSMAQPRPAHYNQPFIEKYIFPGGYIPALSEVVPAVEKSAQLLIRDTEILSLHYAETTRAWRERFLANRERVLALYDERFIRMWEFYLAGSEAAFRFDRLHVFHLQLAHEQDARAADPRLHPGGDGPARRGRARLRRLCPGSTPARRLRPPCEAAHRDRSRLAFSCRCEKVCVARKPCSGAVPGWWPVEPCAPAGAVGGGSGVEPPRSCGIERPGFCVGCLRHGLKLPVAAQHPLRRSAGLYCCRAGANRGISVAESDRVPDRSTGGSHGRRGRMKRRA